MLGNWMVSEYAADWRLWDGCNIEIIFACVLLVEIKIENVHVCNEKFLEK